MARKDQLPKRIFKTLYGHFGPQNWWPGETPFEVAVGAILTQNTAWSNVEMAIANIKAKGLMTPEGIRRTSRARLAKMVRPSGYYNQKATRVKILVDHLFEHHDGHIGVMLDGPLERVRKELLSLNGIGPETADSILLYAGGHPTFVIDAYTIRIAARYPLPPSEGKSGTLRYDMHKRYFESCLEPDPALFNEYHALLVMLGKLMCRPRPDCPSCPLNGSCRKKI